MIRVKKMPIESTDRRVLEGGGHAGAGAALIGRQAVHDPGLVRRGEQAHREPDQRRSEPEQPDRRS